jgi:hypothetical protein
MAQAATARVGSPKLKRKLGRWGRKTVHSVQKAMHPAEWAGVAGEAVGGALDWGRKLIGNPGWMTALQYTSTTKSEAAAREELEGLKLQQGFLGGRVLPPRYPELDKWRVQALFQDEPEYQEGALEGMRRVKVPPGMGKRLLNPSYYREEANKLTQILRKHGWAVLADSEAESTDSLYMTVESPLGGSFFVRLSSHPKPGYSRMVSHGAWVYGRRAEEIWSYLQKHADGGVHPRQAESNPLFGLFGKRKQKKSHPSHPAPSRRSPMTISQSISAAYDAGAEIGSTAAFEGWLKRTGLDTRGDFLKKKLRAAFERGVEEGAAPAMEAMKRRRARAAGHWDAEGKPVRLVTRVHERRHRGHEVWQEDGIWRTSLDPETEHESAAEDKKFIDAWEKGRQGNPERAEQGVYLGRDSFFDYWQYKGHYYRVAVGNAAYLLPVGVPANARREGEMWHFEKFVRPRLIVVPNPRSRRDYVGASELSVRDVEMLTTLREAQPKPTEIYPTPEDYISRKEWLNLKRRGLVDPITHRPSIKGWVQMEYAAGRDPWEGLPRPTAAERAEARGNPLDRHIPVTLTADSTRDGTPPHKVYRVLPVALPYGRRVTLDGTFDSVAQAERVVMEKIRLALADLPGKFEVQVKVGGAAR